MSMRVTKTSNEELYLLYIVVSLWLGHVQKRQHFFMYFIRNNGLVISALDSRSSGPGMSPCRGLALAFLSAVVTRLFGTSNFICSRTHPPLLFSGLGPFFLLFILLFSLPILLNLTRGAWRLNFRAEVRKFLGVEWIATGPKDFVPFHSQNEFQAPLKWRMLDHRSSNLHRASQ